jgi:hypothetical protein
LENLIVDKFCQDAESNLMAKVDRSAVSPKIQLKQIINPRNTHNKRLTSLIGVETI